MILFDKRVSYVKKVTNHCFKRKLVKWFLFFSILSLCKTLFVQANEVSIIRRKCTSFEVKQHEYRERFRKLPTFRYDCEDPYPELDKMHEEISDLEAEMDKLQESAGLFEVNVPDYKQLKVSDFLAVPSCCGVS